MKAERFPIDLLFLLLEFLIEKEKYIQNELKSCLYTYNKRSCKTCIILFINYFLFFQSFFILITPPTQIKLQRV